MTELAITDGFIFLRSTVTGTRETIPGDLVDVAIRALPEEHPARTILRQWRQSTSEIPLEPSELHSLEQQLAKYVYLSSNKLGLVARLSNRSTGNIVSVSDLESAASVSALVVLALAIRRFIALYGVGVEMAVLPQIDYRREP
ncbi:MAG: hypothetical protein P4L33_10040 [Capsulimonadaceae bacterium]|nr:hypothetical protein [Capsulimonadaceae bacterium]